MEKTNYKDIKWKENGKLKLLIIVGTRDYSFSCSNQ